jgi:hypothetical protein
LYSEDHHWYWYIQNIYPDIEFQFGFALHVSVVFVHCVILVLDKLNHEQIHHCDGVRSQLLHVFDVKLICHMPALPALSYIYQDSTHHDIVNVVAKLFQFIWLFVKL